MNQREILTFTGKVFDFFKPEPEMICIADIAHALALTNRYSGHTSQPYSVAEHSVRCSHIPIGDPLLNLMHDSAEAYIGDIPSPQKKGLGWEFPPNGFHIQYEQFETEILRQIGMALGVRQLKCWLTMPKETHVTDKIMIATEVRDLMPPIWVEKFSVWLDEEKPLAEKIVPWSWDKAEQEFLSRFYELRGLNG
jgi:hypothetical protein